MAMALDPGGNQSVQEPFLLCLPDNSRRCDDGAKLLVPSRALRERGVRRLPRGSTQRGEKPSLTTFRLPNSPEIERRQRRRRERQD